MTLTPYDTGERLSPIPWVQGEAKRRGTAKPDDYGKVDFDNDESSTVITAHVERDGYGYVLHIGGELAGIEATDMLVVSPSEALQRRVRDIIAELPTEHEREAEVYWSDNNRRAMILVPGEKHVRKQLLISVTDVGDGEPNSAVVKDWAGGVQRTRID